MIVWLRVQAIGRMKILYGFRGIVLDLIARSMGFPLLCVLGVVGQHVAGFDILDKGALSIADSSDLEFLEYPIGL